LKDKYQKQTIELEFEIKNLKAEIERNTKSFNDKL